MEKERLGNHMFLSYNEKVKRWVTQFHSLDMVSNFTRWRCGNNTMRLNVVHTSTILTFFDLLSLFGTRIGACVCTCAGVCGCVCVQFVTLKLAYLTRSCSRPGDLYISLPQTLSEPVCLTFKTCPC